MVLGARLRTVMSSIIRWRKAEILPAGGIEYAEGLLLLIASKGTGKRRPTPSWRSSNQVSVRLAGRGKRTPGPGQRRANPTGRVSTLRDNAPGTDVKGPHGMDAPEPRLWTGAPERADWREAQRSRAEQCHVET